MSSIWLDKDEIHCACDPVTVSTGANVPITIDKLYGPLCASEVRVTLQYTDDVTDWVVEYLNPTTELWEEKARWNCQENWPEDNDE